MPARGCNRAPRIRRGYRRREPGSRNHAKSPPAPHGAIAPTPPKRERPPAAVPVLRRYEVHWESEAAPEDVIAVPTISGACFCMRREDFEAVQGFDEGYFLHVEDVDLCWRVRQGGGEVLFQPKAEVIHLGHTSHASPLRVEFHKGVGLARYFRKRAENGREALLAWAISPLIVCTAIARPVMWRIRGRAA